MGGQPVLLLQTTGRRSGRTRTTPVQYLADGDTFVVVASNAGAPRPPAWYLNLRANPHARIRVGGRNIDVRAQEAAGQERVALWRRLTAVNRYLERAASKARRDLPLLALVPATPYGVRGEPPTAVTTSVTPTPRFHLGQAGTVSDWPLALGRSSAPTCCRIRPPNGAVPSSSGVALLLRFDWAGALRRRTAARTSNAAAT